MSRTPMPGGWYPVNRSGEFITQLHNDAAIIANVQQGAVREAYAQVIQSLLLLFFKKR